MLIAVGSAPLAPLQRVKGSPRVRRQVFRAVVSGKDGLSREDGQVGGNRPACMFSRMKGSAG
ncbi:hypothetical protein NSPZN2_60039 [Nitrospira defluvii]|uniref:Uncharacterized protein n=1 Tax=Nitrospira defluvii TaxID=330214 RepID=A0ABN7M9B4_9BACT|nr:hypothetical protein NSPZN2_60039 [Nitrospira defluvii]